MARAEHVTTEMHFQCSDSEGVRPFVVRYDDDPEPIITSRLGLAGASLVCW